MNEKMTGIELFIIGELAGGDDNAFNVEEWTRLEFGCCRGREIKTTLDGMIEKGLIFEKENSNSDWFPILSLNQNMWPLNDNSQFDGDRRYRTQTQLP